MFIIIIMLQFYFVDVINFEIFPIYSTLYDFHQYMTLWAYLSCRVLRTSPGVSLHTNGPDPEPQ